MPYTLYALSVVFFITSSSGNPLISAILFTIYFKCNELFLECFSNGSGGKTGLSVSITILSTGVILTVSCTSSYLIPHFLHHFHCQNIFFLLSDF